VSVALTVSERRDLRQGYALERSGVGPHGAQQARLLAGAAIARLDDRTAVAFGFAEGAKAMQRRLAGTGNGNFLVAKDVAGTAGFRSNRVQSIAIRRAIGATGVTFSGETGEVLQHSGTEATGSPYRTTAFSLDRPFGGTALSAGLTRLTEKRTLLGGRMGPVFGGGGSSSLFLDLEARRPLGGGISVSGTVRRGWTDFAGGSFQTGSYAVEASKTDLLAPADRLALRLSQPLRVVKGGLALALPTAYDYAAQVPTVTLERFSLAPRGRELDAELSYGSPVLGGGWLGTNLFFRRQPGHVADAAADFGGALRFTVDF
jgi:hypothetical protein